jgi:Fic family protein
LLIRLVDALFDRPILTIPQAQRLLDVTYPSAQRNVEKLVQAGILQLTGEAAYGKTYVAIEIMNVIGEERTFW